MRGEGVVFLLIGICSCAGVRTAGNIRSVFYGKTIPRVQSKDGFLVENRVHKLRNKRTIGMVAGLESLQYAIYDLQTSAAVMVSEEVSYLILG